MISAGKIDAITIKYEVLHVELDERGRRMWAAAEAESLGHGGIAAVARATGMAESTIRAGRREITSRSSIDRKGESVRRIRKKGGGRKALEEKNSDLPMLLDALVEPTSRGDPISPLRWTCKSTQRLSRELTANGYPIAMLKWASCLRIWDTIAYRAPVKRWREEYIPP